MAVRTLGRIDAYTDAPEKKVTLYLLVLGFIALLLGTLMGPLQAFNYGNVDVYPLLRPLLKSYYQGLTLHGVLNAIVFTQLFAQAVLMYLPARELKMRPNMALAWLAWWMAFVGLAIAALPILTNNASVLYTFYPPLKGHWAFYVGAAIFVLSSWVSIYMVWSMWRQWKRAHPGQITPLITFMSLMTWLMWLLASLGLVVEVAVFLIPWSLGLIAGVDPLLARTLFWFTGHPIVYFWLLPAYVLVYGILPRQAGGKLISDPLARLVFVMFLLFSTPVGFHHQFADPNISPGWKMFHTILTMMVAIPSLITAFTVAASLENAGRARGGQGLLGWIKVLPWNNPAVVALLLGLISFIPGGAGGFVNASFPLNQVVHNTVWIVGHFHLPVATMVTMAAMGAAYWLVPHLTGKPLVRAGFGVAASWLWFGGMNLMGFALHWMGYYGVPRRAHISELPLGTYYSTQLFQVLNILAGIILFIAAIFFFYVLFATLLGKRQIQPAQTSEVPFTEVVSGPKGNAIATLTDQVGLWFGLALVLILVAYGLPLFEMFTHINPVPGMRLW
jgi:cytochrome c oxidase subunit 1